MNSNLKKDLIIANSFFLLLIAFYTLLNAGPLDVKVFLIGWGMLNLTAII